MSVLFLPPPAGAASIPDASETVKGKIRIATSAEATAGTDDLTSMTPAKVKSVVDAAVAGGVTYKGTFDAAAPLDLSNAVQGDLYIIDGAGTYQGKTWAVGDHLLVNADMGGTVDPAKIDKIDSTDSVTSVAGRTGAVVLSTADISGLATVATTGAYSDLSGTPTLGTAAALDVGTGANNVVQLNGSAQLPAVDGSLLTNVSATVAALDDIGDVTITTPANTQVIKYNSTSGDWENGAVAYSELTDSVVVQSFSATATASAISSNALHVFSMGGSGGFTVTLPAATALNGFALFVNGTFSDVTVTGVNFRPHGAATSGGTSSITLKSGERRLYWVYLATIYLEVNSTLLGNNGDVTITSPSNGEALIYNSTSGDWENGTVSASVAALDDIGDVDTTGVSTNNVLKYDGANWVDGSVAYSEVTGTPTLATVATTGAYSDLSGTPSLATVATTGAYSDLTGTPTLGTAAALDVGTSANNVVQLNGSAQLPAVDGSQLTGISATVAALNDIGDVSAAAPNNGDVIAYNSTTGDWEAAAQGVSVPSVTVSSPSADQTLSAPSGIEEAYIYTPSTDITVNLVAAATCGSGFKYQIKNRSTNTITIDPNGSETIDGSSTFDISAQEASVTLITDGSNWFII